MEEIQRAKLIAWKDVESYAKVLEDHHESITSLLKLA
jgi:hypothetical protein